MSQDYVLSPEARADLISIWRYSDGRWGRVQADRHIRLINDAFANLARRPSLGRACDDVRSGHFRIAAGSHVVFFRKADDGIHIVRGLHKSMDFGRHF